MKTCPYNHEGLLAQRAFLWAAIHLPFARRWIVALDDRLGYGSINPVKTWWSDLEIVNGKIVVPRGSNRRGLSLGKPRKQTEIAYYPAESMPPAGAQGPFPVNRKAALAAFPEATLRAALSRARARPSARARRASAPQNPPA
jgi:hypothetical protein